MTEKTVILFKKGDKVPLNHPWHDKNAEATFQRDAELTIEFTKNKNPFYKDLMRFFIRPMEDLTEYQRIFNFTDFRQVPLWARKTTTIPIKLSSSCYHRLSGL